jgi:hypothetical protein
VCCCGCVPQSGTKSSRWFGKGATSSIVTADVDIPDKVLEKRIHLAEASEEEEQGISVGLSASRAGARARARARARRSGEGVPPVRVCCWYLRSSSQGFLRKGRVPEFARTVGDNEVVGPIPLSLDWEVLSVMVASVDQYEDFGSGARAERRTFSHPLLKNGLLCWKSAA